MGFNFIFKSIMLLPVNFLKGMDRVEKYSDVIIPLIKVGSQIQLTWLPLGEEVAGVVYVVFVKKDLT
ncbi:hypothetical protein CEX98_21930 [Pseudoalteromonas piscicida]|uniref:Uncharacterized protein n=1 Tax=Pseudoalteromonas piscicida TaxID=43662 RepID=A0A2A5JJI4_PSEO7|nr:hypothetical protein CEX98_21930 [Pseudoalteromonas piscicida]